MGTGVTHRVVEIAWKPSSATQWQVFTASRVEAARLWTDMIVRHRRIRCFGKLMKWPSKMRWMRWVKRRYPGLSAQSAQQMVGEFLEAVRSTRQLHKNGYTGARFPWRTPRYRDVTYTNQGADVRGRVLALSNGKVTGPLRVKLPRGFVEPGRLMEVILSFGVVRLVYLLSEQVGVAPPEITITVGIDLGVNTLIAAGDDQRAVLISGREAKATIQWRAKKLSEFAVAQSALMKGSRRWRRIQRRKHLVLDKARNRIRDITHKATRIVADAFPNAKAVVGKPFNDAAQKMGRKQAQQVSQACNRKIIALLAYKLAGGVTEVEEHYTSQTCPLAASPLASLVAAPRATREACVHRSVSSGMPVGDATDGVRVDRVHHVRELDGLTVLDACHDAREHHGTTDVLAVRCRAPVPSGRHRIRNLAAKKADGELTNVTPRHDVVAPVDRRREARVARQLAPREGTDPLLAGRRVCDVVHRAVAARHLLKVHAAAGLTRSVEQDVREDRVFGGAPPVHLADETLSERESGVLVYVDGWQRQRNHRGHDEHGLSLKLDLRGSDLSGGDVVVVVRRAVVLCEHRACDQKRNDEREEGVRHGPTLGSERSPRKEKVS
jgi:hypothetical protein